MSMAFTTLAGAVSTNHSASFTRLSFHPHGQGPERVGRRLTAVSDGWRLNGNLKTLGYFAANVCLGADHKTFSLIVDTGSSLAAMPCSDCSGCGHHKTGARFDPSRPGATSVDCHHPPSNMHCSSCGTGSKCGYSVSYTEGSSISGYMVQDKLHLSSDQGEKAIDATFGCQTRETGLFHSQQADGIVGFSNSAAYGPTFMDRLVSGLHAPNVFSMCLSEEVGAMVMGGAIPDDLEASWISTSRASKSYAVTITDFHVAGVTVGGAASQYNEAIVDSGTTFTYLPPTPYNKAKDHFRNHCAPWARGTGEEGWGGEVQGGVSVVVARTAPPHANTARAPMRPCPGDKPPVSHAPVIGPWGSYVTHDRLVGELCVSHVYLMCISCVSHVYLRSVGQLRTARGQGRVPRRLLLHDERGGDAPLRRLQVPLLGRAEPRLRPSAVHIRAA